MSNYVGMDKLNVVIISGVLRATVYDWAVGHCTKSPASALLCTLGAAPALRKVCFPIRGQRGHLFLRNQSAAECHAVHPSCHVRGTWQDAKPSLSSGGPQWLDSAI